jgi:phosphatidylserine decarboxylase
MSIAREGWLYVLTLVGVGSLVALRLPWVGGVLVALGLFTAFFFRDPERAIPQGEHLVVAPADGKVVRLVEAPDENPCGAGATQLSIFLSIFDVHVNRAPVAGRVAGVEYRPGEFLPAFDQEASQRNEQNVVTLEGDVGRVVFKQIAGLVARRIVFRKRVGDVVERGERVGMIKFGSRVDVFLPRGFRSRVAVGDKVYGGSSVLGELGGGDPS